MGTPETSSPNCDNLCPTCPGRFLAPGEYNVREPMAGEPFSVDREKGFKVDGRGTPVCVHYEKIEMKPGRYVQPRGDEVLSVPEGLTEDQIRAWAIDKITNADPAFISETIGDIEALVTEVLGDSENIVDDSRREPPRSTVFMREILDSLTEAA